jgi:predicted regulator of Ras-like GTPase activity (Roadblock/LC7/MglB family)
MRTLWDSSEIKEAAALFNEILARSGEPPGSPAGSPGMEKVGGAVYRGDRLEEELVSMCSRGKFSGAVLADIHGLPLAVHNSPVGDDVLAASTSVLAESLEKTTRLLNQPNVNNISMDINYMDKIVLRKFFIDKELYFLMIISPQHVDERAEVELSISHISTILKKR